MKAAADLEANGITGGELPEGVIAIPLTHYRVGEYTYTSLADALAEHRRSTQR